MKILVMGTGQGLGGLHTHLLRLLEFFVAEGNEASAFVVADPEMPFDAPRGVKSVARVRHSARSLWERWRKFAELRRLERETRRIAPDLFVATATGRGYAQIARCARAGGAFAIWQEVSLPAAGDPLHTEMCRSVDAVAVQTPGMLEPFRQAIPSAAKAGCLPCFFEAVMTDAIARPPEKGEPVRLAYFGRLAGNKGLVPFLEVFREVSRAVPLRLDIHGGGEERAAIERRISELGLGGSVCMKGRYPAGAEYGRLLASYHALVLPSTECEGLPLVLLEAMSCGLPVLATDVGGIADVGVGNPDAVVVAPRADALADGLRRLAAALETGAISNERLKAHAAGNFSNGRFAATWREMLANPPRFFSA
jgi:glycosyltransferase involved in cell wall biosynthesis